MQPLTPRFPKLLNNEKLCNQFSPTNFSFSYFSQLSLDSCAIKKFIQNIVVDRLQTQFVDTYQFNYNVGPIGHVYLQFAYIIWRKINVFDTIECKVICCGSVRVICVVWAILLST